MGRTVLSSQFVAGVQNEIKIKLAGMEGDMYQLLVRARFEEAKQRDLVHTDESMGTERRPPGAVEQPQWRTQSKSIEPTRLRGSSGAGNSVTLDKCFLCRGTGHFQQNCSYQGRADPKEARYQPRQGRKVAAVVPRKPGQDQDCYLAERQAGRHGRTSWWTKQ